MKNHREKRHYTIEIYVDCITTNNFKIDVFERMISAFCVGLENGGYKKGEVTCQWRAEEEADL